MTYKLAFLLCLFTGFSLALVGILAEAGMVVLGALVLLAWFAITIALGSVMVVVEYRESIRRK